MSEWQPIETAPKDGMNVLLYEGHEPIISQGSWDEESQSWYHPHGEFWRQPTHWMPLPEPPAE